ncbi:hypothetical protein BC628DRAFT_1332462 [Trametes gibbosa]|nr:hypothetical protein BC628DRAFT_1332462 [Trametes gibbosa]
MSDTDPETEELIAFFQSVFINTCCPIAVLAWLTYEFLITFDREVDLFWRRNFTGASILFLTNRYLPILVNVLNISSDASICDSYVKALQTIQLLQYVPWAAFSSLRTFALSARNWIVTTVVLLLSIVPIGVNFTQYHWLAVVNDPIVGCTKSSTVTLETAKRCVALKEIGTCLMAADLIVILVTWRTTLGTTRLNRAVLKNRPTFARMLLQDGEWNISYITLFVLNALHLAFTMFSITRDPLSPVSYFTTFTEPVTAVLVSRFLLDLQQVNQHNQKSSLSPTLTQDGTLDFAWAIGSLGSPLSNSQTSRISSLGGNADTCAYTDDAMATLWDQTELYMLEARRSLTRITVD